MQTVRNIIPSGIPEALQGILQRLQGSPVSGPVGSQPLSTKALV
jgi:hypothetical protein